MKLNMEILTNRILYAFFTDYKVIPFHHFTKKTQKTPLREIVKAKSELEDYIRRNKNDG